MCPRVPDVVPKVLEISTVVCPRYALRTLNYVAHPTVNPRGCTSIIVLRYTRVEGKFRMRNSEASRTPSAGQQLKKPNDRVSGSHE